MSAGDGLTEAERDALLRHFDLNYETMLYDAVRATVERIVAARVQPVEQRAQAAEAERDASHEEGYWVGYREGRVEAETRDLDYDALTDRAEAAERRLAAVEAANKVARQRAEYAMNHAKAAGDLVGRILSACLADEVGREPLDRRAVARRAHDAAEAASRAYLNAREVIRDLRAALSDATEEPS